jgi:hypothetical protein
MAVAVSPFALVYEHSLRAGTGVLAGFPPFATAYEHSLRAGTGALLFSPRPRLPTNTLTTQEQGRWLAIPRLRLLTVYYLAQERRPLPASRHSRLFAIHAYAQVRVGRCPPPIRLHFATARKRDVNSRHFPSILQRHRYQRKQSRRRVAIIVPHRYKLV